MNCHDCGKELTNGIDTFGPLGDEVCLSCNFKRYDDDVSKQITELEAKLDRLQDERYDLEERLASIETRIMRVQDDIEVLRLRGHGDDNHQRAILSIVKANGEGGEA